MMKKIIFILIMILSLSSCYQNVDDMPELTSDKLGCSVDGIILIDFYADWCGPCRSMSPKVDKVKEEMQGIAKIIKIDCDRSGLDEMYNVKSIPTFIVFKNGKPIKCRVGSCSKKSLKDLIKTAEK